MSWTRGRCRASFTLVKIHTEWHPPSESRRKNNRFFCKKQSSLNKILQPCALVVISGFANAALLRAGASSLQKTPCKSNRIGTAADTDTDTDLGACWLPPRRLLVPPGSLLGASWRLWVSPGASSLLPPPGCLINHEFSTP